MNNFQDQGRALYKRGDYRKAIGFFDRATGRASSVQLLDNRAACYEKLGELSTALKDAKKAIQLQREDATGYLRAGKVLVKMDKESVALEIYTHGLKSIKHVGQGYELLRKSQKDLMDKLSPPKSVDPLTQLPRELAEQVLEYLSFRQRMNASLVSKEWAGFIRTCPNLWKHLDLSGARKQVRSSFVSKAINVARTRLTAATLNRLFDLDKSVVALTRHCSLEELTLLRCGLQGQSLTDALSKAKALKRLRLGGGTELQPYQLQHLLKAVSAQIESFHCIISPGGMATIDGPECASLRTLSLSFSTTQGLTSLLANISKCMPALQSLTLQQTDTNPGMRTGMHMDLDKCTHLEHLDLSLVFTSTSLLTLPQSLRAVRLNPMLVANPDLFFRPITQGIQPRYSLPNMEELSMELQNLDVYSLRYMLDGNPDVEKTPEGPMCHSKLRKLGMKGCEVYPNSLEGTLSHQRLAEVESLSLAGCQPCSDESVVGIIETLPKLKTLDLSQTNITGVGVKSALKAKHLQKLVVNDCRLIGVDAIEWARSTGVQVEYRMTDNISGGRKVRY